MTDIKDNSIARTAGNPMVLHNVTLIRPILIILLVFYHAFAPFSGAWEPISGYPDIPVYWWLDKTSYAFMLETFVFISGFVFGFQVRIKGESKLNAKNLFWNKFKRLFIPSIVFSLLYLLLFQRNYTSIIEGTYNVVNGVAHMWFLPMLFWCFVLVWVIEKLRIPTRFNVCLFGIMAFLPIPSLPLQLSKTFYYFIFFLVGYLIQRKSIDLTRFYTRKYAIISVLLFFVLFPTLTILSSRNVLIGGG